MRKIYITVALLLVISIILFIASFAYIDKTKRRSYDYVASLGGGDISTIRVDRFSTDEKIIYKSSSETPFDPLYTGWRSRLDLDRRYALESYLKESSCGKITDIVYLENRKGLVSFVSRQQSRFTCVDNIPTRKDIFVFDEESPMTYMPIIANYDFSKGRSQMFNVLTPAKDPGLPPVKKIITLTSINDEYLKIGTRKIKTENLIIKTRDRPQIAVWVAKSDRAIIKIRMPSKDMTVIRTFRTRNVYAKKPMPQDPRYISREVAFKHKNTEITATMTIPTKEGRFPAALMLAGEGPSDRDLQGLFSSLAGYLSKNGFSVLRFDRRGTGSSRSDAMSSTENDETSDAMAALEYLKTQDTTDPGNIVLIAHGAGARVAFRMIADNANPKGLIMMAPSLGAFKDPAKPSWSEEYKALVAQTRKATEERAMASKGAWTSILGVRCYVNRIREEIQERPYDTGAGPELPILIMQGKEDEDLTWKAAEAFDAALRWAGRSNLTLTYYNNLGHFFGSLVNNGYERMHYEADDRVLGEIVNWLNSIPASKPKTPDEPSGDAKTDVAQKKADQG